MYDLSGRRITCPIHGLNIINGKNVIIKSYTKSTRTNLKTTIS